MKIVAVSHSCVVGPNQKIFVALRGIPGVEVELIVPARWRSEYTGKLHLPETHPDADFPVHSLPVVMPGHVWLHFYRRGLSETIRRAAPDVVFLDQEPWSLVAAQVTAICRKLGVPCVGYTKQNIRKRYPFPFNLIERRTHQTCTAMIALTEEAKEVVRAKGYAGPCPVLSHGYDRSIFRPGNQEQQRQSLGLHGIVIGYMGRFVAIKGLGTMIDAVKRLTTFGSLDFSVLIVGSGPMEKEWKGQIAREGLEKHFVFSGPVSHRQAPEYLRCMDLLVVPSVTQKRAKEQFGRVIVEAMACGVPVVGSSSGNIPYLIEETGGGEIFPEGDATALATVLQDLITDSDRRRLLGRTGAKNVGKHFTYRTLSVKLHQILASCCDGATAASEPAAEFFELSGLVDEPCEIFRSNPEETVS